MILTEQKQAILRWRKDPTAFDREMFGISEFDDWEIEFNRAYATHRQLAIAAGRGTGKTNILARRAWQHQFCYWPAATFITGPKKETIIDGVLPALMVWHAALPDWAREPWNIGPDTITSKATPAESRIMLRTTAQNRPDGLKGPRARHMLVMGDEFSDISDLVHRRLLGFLTTAYGRFIAMSQPTRLDGPFHGMFHSARDEYWTQHVSSMESRHVDRAFVRSIAAEYGEDSDDYRVDVLGLFPLSTTQRVYSLSFISNCRNNTPPPQMVRPAWGYDHAEGGDRCALAKRQGLVQLQKIRTWREEDPAKSMDLLAEDYHSTPDELKPSVINIDATGIGADVQRMLVKRHVHCAHAIMVGMTAKDKRYSDIRTWLAFLGREWCRGGGSLIDDDDQLHEEMLQLSYGRTAMGKRKLTPKDQDYPRSPDRLDAWLLTFGRKRMNMIEVAP